MRFKWFRCLAICLILLLAVTLLVAARVARQSNKNAFGKNQNSSATKRRKMARRNQNSQVERTHCNDSPPANPSNCNINQSFVVGCELPFADSVSHEIDQRCPNEGCATRDSDKAQNRVKNNLCATGTPVQISFTSLDKLQRAVDKMVRQGQISYGSTGPPQPADRVKLKGLTTVDQNGDPVTLGEGDLAMLEGFVLDAKHDDTFVLGTGPVGFQGEGVNCKNSLFEWNDIHIVLGSSGSARECASATAEIIPHFRPAVWDRFDSNSCTSTHVTNPLPVKGLRVRITGQLFFDGSHKPSPCGVAPGVGDPVRRSVWEIHPVYKIEVFDGARFISLQDWAAAQHP